ncbi:MAG: hypothetical protein HY231_18525 [Acidobacteria bacterium]|nr:hypothetical protein [Acidobacteriota bacterium]
MNVVEKRLDYTLAQWRKQADESFFNQPVDSSTGRRSRDWFMEIDAIIFCHKDTRHTKVHEEFCVSLFCSRSRLKKSPSKQQS